MLEPEKMIQRLQSLRARPERDLTIGRLVENLQEQADKSHKKMGELVELWTEFLPEELVSQTTLVGLRGGVLTINADSSAIVYELDRRLREGLLAELRLAYRGTLSRVKVKLGQPSGGKTIKRKPDR